MNRHLSHINDNFLDFQQLIRFWESCRYSSFETINIHLSGFFSADMSAPFGAILDILETRNNIALSATPEIQTILCKNDFLSFYNYSSIYDNFNTTIPYVKFKRSDSHSFASYISDQLLNRTELPQFSQKARNKIASVIQEIFANSVQHTTTEYIYACGQFFPSKKHIDFSIVDTGAGIATVVNSIMSTPLNAVDAIKWALIDGHTTKKGVPGGYGLSILQSFLHHNHGRMQIISNNGYYCDDNGKKSFYFFEADFPGTVLNLRIMTNDDKLYALKGE